MTRPIYVYLLSAVAILLSLGFCAGRASAQTPPITMEMPTDV